MVIENFKKGFLLNVEQDQLGLVAYSDSEYYYIYEYYREDNGNIILEDNCLIKKLVNNFKLTNNMLEILLLNNFGLGETEYESILISLEDFEDKYPYRAYSKDLFHNFEKAETGLVYRCGYCGYNHFYLPFNYNYEGNEKGLISKNILPEEEDSVKCILCNKKVINPKIILNL